jgi:hypothetical protein
VEFTLERAWIFLDLSQYTASPTTSGLSGYAPQELESTIWGQDIAAFLFWLVSPLNPLNPHISTMSSKKATQDVYGCLAERFNLS